MNAPTLWSPSKLHASKHFALWWVWYVCTWYIVMATCHALSVWITCACVCWTYWGHGVNFDGWIYHHVCRSMSYSLRSVSGSISWHMYRCMIGHGTMIGWRVDHYRWQLAATATLDQMAVFYLQLNTENLCIRHLSQCLSVDWFAGFIPKHYLFAMAVILKFNVSAIFANVAFMHDPACANRAPISCSMWLTHIYLAYTLCFQRPDIYYRHRPDPEWTVHMFSCLLCLQVIWPSCGQPSFSSGVHVSPARIRIYGDWPVYNDPFIDMGPNN